MSEISLIFPHQLFDPHPALKKSRPVILIEDTLFFGDKDASPGRFHRQKIVLHRASMQAFATRLASRGYNVEVCSYQRDKQVQVILRQLIQKGFQEFHFTEPGDFLLNKRIERFCENNDVVCQKYESPMFLTPPDWAEDHFGKRKKPFMAAFYKLQRQRMNILIDSNGEPTGGRWSYDDENRKPMPKRGGLDVPPEPSPQITDEVARAIADVESGPEFADYPGNAAKFAYATTHEAAEDWLEHFLNWRFDRFGPYEDAVSCKERVLFHSVLTPMLNIGLLTPNQIIERAMDFAAENDTPIQSVEGFVRQIIGWREFIFLMYRRHGVEMRNGNFFGHSRSIPASFWTGKTGIDPIDQTIHRILDHSYCHHIERLMLLGNFMLLCGFNPIEVNDWFHELFIDGYDWVMVPNVFGMSQFADGGIFTTKPYISGSNYVRKMSDYPKGEWCEVWDGLFWNFIDQHREFFLSQHRMSMMARQLDKMDAEKRRTHLEKANSFLCSL